MMSLKTWLLDFLNCSDIYTRFSAFDWITKEPYSGFIICNGVKYMIKRGILSAIPKKVYKSLAKIKGLYETLPETPWLASENDYVKHMRVAHFSLLKKGVNHLRVKEGSILCLGCGWGWEIWTLLRLLKNPTNFKFVGLDIARKPLKRARLIAIRKKLYNLDFIVAPVDSLPFKSNSFDMVTAIFGALDHTENYIKAFKELSRVLKPGGIGVITLLNKFSLDWILRVIFNPKLFIKTVKKAKEPLTRITIPINKKTSIRIPTHYYNPLEIRLLIKKADLEVLYTLGIFTLLPMNFKLKKFKKGHKMLSRIERLLWEKPLVRSLGRYISLVVRKKW